MELTLVAVLTTALFAVITMLGVALFQLPARFDRALGELRRELKDELREQRAEHVAALSDLRGEMRDLRGEVRELRERFEEHLRLHDQPV